MIDRTAVTERRPPRPGLDDRRPFGVHFRMPVGRSVVLVVALPLTLLLSQLALRRLAALVEGTDPLAPTLTPLRLLAANLSTGLTALLAMVLVVRFAGVPWRRVLSSPRAPDPRRLVVYLLGSAALVGVGMAVVAGIAPGSTGWRAFGISGTTVAVLVVVALSTPFQAAGEEIIFRGAILPAAGSWFRAVRPAFLAGLVVSGLAFALVHGRNDPWLFGYYVFLSACTAQMGRISRGLDAAVAFHVANNVVITSVNVLLAGGGVIAVDGSNGAGGGPALLVLAAVDLAVVAMVWHRERRQGSDHLR
ncbi:CPBP family intramembrane glutamic endopeptidase [Auraticoccus monumenti]|uniref:Membrane protease YdiL, CAAX protease family n=1 Tax=Auraticoccus monumenti TaxID=675864 RepID=A0A1G6UXA4_9ACTN|nr:type II CAAX endopeptidase family protein [Auraticoccus monumenti]SDD45265.1 Membrane protease YdiL, CAAX protease family [Auraticoccus monumenti]